MNKTVVTYKPETDTKSGKGLRLYIKGGVIQNPSVEAQIVADLEHLTAVAIARTGEKKRSLVYQGE